MSIETLLNSPNATYEYPLTIANSVASASLTMAVNDGTSNVVIPAICITNSATLNYLTVPAGTYNIQMICGIKPGTDSILNYAQLIITNIDGDIITTSSSKSFNGTGTITQVYWSFNESQRVVFGKETEISMRLVYSGLSDASTLYNGTIPLTIDGDAKTINLNPQIILTPTF
jgi:hypothetical protein